MIPCVVVRAHIKFITTLYIIASQSNARTDKVKGRLNHCLSFLLPDGRQAPFAGRVVVHLFFRSRYSYTLSCFLIRFILRNLCSRLKFSLID